MNLSKQGNRIFIVLLVTAFLVSVLIFFYMDTVDINGSADQAASSVIVVINEVMSSNKGIIPDDQGNFSDWIELYNPGEEAANLSNWGLSDTQDRVKWTFPEGTVLKPKEYLLVYCSGNNNQEDQASHANFSLKTGEEEAVLTNSLGVVIDSVPILEVTEGHSISRALPDYTQWEDRSLPTPGFENSDEGRAQYEQSMKAETIGVQINEFQASNISTFPEPYGQYPDWIELYNSTDRSIDLSGYGLSDDRLRPLKWKFPEGTTILAGEYILIYADELSDPTGQLSGLHASFKLNSYAESVVFNDPLGRELDAIDYIDIPRDDSYGRNIRGEWEVMIQPTPGFENSDEGYKQFSELYGTTLQASDLYISEVMLYNRGTLTDTDGESYDWIEIHNASDATINLADYGVSDNSANPAKWRFPEGTQIDPGEYLVLMASGTPDSESINKSEQYIHLNFKLSNQTGEILTLWSPEGAMIDRIACRVQRNQSSYGRNSPGGSFLVYPTPTPGQANGKGYNGYALESEILLPAGLYNGEQIVSIAVPVGYQAFYTTDGSEPTQHNEEVTSDITIKNTTSLRVRTFSQDTQVLPSATQTATYIINNPHSEALTIVSLSTDEENFYDNETGIYVKGSNASDEFPFLGANFWQRDWERPVHVEIFESDGTLLLQQDAAIRIFGSYSRGKAQKGLAIIARSEYGPNRFNAKLFDNRPYESYKSFILRASAQDSTITKMRDIIATSLVDGTTNLEVQAYRQAVVYLNGEYFGIYNIREKVTKYFVADHYGLEDPENIDLLVGNGTALVGDSTAYEEMIEWCASHNLSIQENYEKISAQIDIENYIDYLIAEMYVANSDTGNIKFFRERSEDPEKSKWRWIYYDFCWSFFEYDRDSFAKLTDPEGHGVGNGFSTQLTRSLMQNQDFRNQFLRRFAELLNTIYTPENVIARIKECEARIMEEMPRDVERWSSDYDVGGIYSISSWQTWVTKTKEFAEKRPAYMIGYLRQHFSLSKADTIRIFGQEGIITETVEAGEQEEHS